MKKLERGFSVVEVVLIVGTLALVAGLGFVAWKSIKASEEPANTSAAAPNVELIVNKKDLEQAEKELDNLNFSDDSAEAAAKQADL